MEMNEHNTPAFWLCVAILTPVFIVIVAALTFLSLVFGDWLFRSMREVLP